MKTPAPIRGELVR
jgi:aldehyde dehydrogenase family 7 member A1